MSESETAAPAERIVEAIGESWELPVDTLKEASQHRDQVAAKLIARLDSAADLVLDDAEAQIILLGTALLAEWRDTRAYEPLIRFLRSNPEEAETCFGDEAADVLTKCLVALAEGQDLGQLLKIVGSKTTDVSVRLAALDAWCYVAWSRGMDAEALRNKLVEIYDGFDLNSEPLVVSRWAELVVILGLDSMEPWIDTVLQSQIGQPLAWVTRDDLDEIEHERNERGVEAAFQFSSIEPFRDTIATFSKWHGFTPEGAAERKQHYEALLDEVEQMEFDELEDDSFEGSEAWGFRSANDQTPERDYWRAPHTVGHQPTQPASNPYRDVGRNDPCPCGSGKKFKKCCAA